MSKFPIVAHYEQGGKKWFTVTHENGQVDQVIDKKAYDALAKSQAARLAPKEEPAPSEKE